MSRKALFVAEGVRAFELASADMPLVQRFFDQNPEYWLAINGQPPPADLAPVAVHRRHRAARQGFVELRQRTGVDTGGRINTVRVLLKPLGTRSAAEYFALSPRDQPQSTLP